MSESINNILRRNLESENTYSEKNPSTDLKNYPSYPDGVAHRYASREDKNVLENYKKERRYVSDEYTDESYDNYTQKKELALQTEDLSNNLGNHPDLKKIRENHPYVQEMLGTMTVGTEDLSPEALFGNTNNQNTKTENPDLSPESLFDTQPEQSPTKNEKFGDLSSDALFEKKPEKKPTDERKNKYDDLSPGALFN